MIIKKNGIMRASWTDKDVSAIINAVSCKLHKYTDELENGTFLQDRVTIKELSEYGKIVIH